MSSLAASVRPKRIAIIALVWAENPAVAYGGALLIGLGFVLALSPPLRLLGLGTAGIGWIGDTAQHVIGQRYFLHDPWRWPPLIAPGLRWPEGVNVAFTDSIPLVLLPVKLFRSLLPPGYELVQGWLGLCWLAQPVAAVFALRAAGERRALPAFAVAVISISMPTMLWRVGEQSLCSHFLLLAALGLYFRAVAGRSGGWAAMAGGLLVAALLIHPYLLAMSAALLAAAPLALALRRDRAWADLAASWLAAILATAAVALAFGYGPDGSGRVSQAAVDGAAIVLLALAAGIGAGGWARRAAMVPLGAGLVLGSGVMAAHYVARLRAGADPWSGASGGFGRYSMNLLSPVVPFDSALLPGVPMMDATGGQYEGYQYLGAGLLVLVAVALWTMRRGGGALLRRHLGLALVCVALAAFAVSNDPWLGHLSLGRLGHAPAILDELRSSGRFFWPVAYVLLIGSVALVASRLPTRVAAAVLVLGALLQFADAGRLRQKYWSFEHDNGVWQIDAAGLRPVFAASRSLVLWPRYECGLPLDKDPLYVQVLLLASVDALHTDTMYTAHLPARPECDPRQVLGAAWRPGEVRILLPQAASEVGLVPEGTADCRRDGSLVVCTEGARR